MIRHNPYMFYMLSTYPFAGWVILQKTFGNRTSQIMSMMEKLVFLYFIFVACSDVKGEVTMTTFAGDRHTDASVTISVSDNLNGETSIATATFSEDVQSDGDRDVFVTHSTLSDNLTDETTVSYTANFHISSLNGTPESEIKTVNPTTGQPLIPCGQAGSFKLLAANCSAGHRDAAERVCGCASTCSILNNCCCDSQFVNSEVPSSKVSECVSGITTRIALSSPAFLINKCPVAWPNDAVRRYCEEPSSENIFEDVPCYNPETGLSFINSFCSQCHDVKNCQNWELAFQCNFRIPFDYLGSIDDMKAIIDRRPFSRRGCQFTVFPNLEQKIAQCLPYEMVDSCPQFATEGLKQNCRMYFNPVKIGFTFYRNIDCFYCNNDGELNVMIEPYMRNNLTPLSALLKHKQVPVQGRVGTGDINTQHIITRIRGYSKIESIFAQITGLNVAAIDGDMLNEIDLSCVGHIKTILSWNLRAFEHSIGTEIKESVSKQMRAFRITMTIEQDMSLSRVEEIRTAMKDVTFSFQVEDQYTICCCFYENGTPWMQEPNMRMEPTPSLDKGSNSSVSLLTSTGPRMSDRSSFGIVVLCYAMAVHALWVK